LEEDEELRSYDVSALFTSVPVDKAMEVIRKKLEEDDTLYERTPLSPDDIIKLLDLCLRCTYFSFQGVYYLQIHGAAMGSPVSPIVCNLYMEHFEHKAIATAEHPPRWWRRYVDDTHTILKKDHAQGFTDHLNQVDEDIKWTTEGEVVVEVQVDQELELGPRTERALAFLDTWTVVDPDGGISTKVFRKETHTDQYLNFSSNHPLEHKRGVVRTLFHRAESIVSKEEDKVTEKEHIRSALRLNGYPDWITKDVATPAQAILEEEVDATLGAEGVGTVAGDPQPGDPPPAEPNPQKRRRPIVIPYVKGFSEEYRRILKGYETPVYFKPTNTLRQLLVRPKDKIIKERVVGPVYKIKCEDCEDSYIGETERSLKTRFAEHRRPSTVTSEVSRHINSDHPEHSISMDATEILSVEPRWFEKGVKEVIHIRVSHPSLNRDGGRYNLPTVWDNLLKR
jgi:hypothetical protein